MGHLLECTGNKRGGGRGGGGSTGRGEGGGGDEAERGGKCIQYLLFGEILSNDVFSWRGFHLIRCLIKPLKGEGRR